MNKHLLTKRVEAIKGRAVLGMVLLLTTALMAPGLTNAQGLTDNSSSGTQLFCKRDFSNFIVNGIDFDGEGFTDYWRDIIIIYNANYCQYSDISSLLDRIDKARKQLRQAFYVCDSATVARVTGTYYQLSAELYYLRHFVETSASPNPNASEAEKAQKVMPRAAIKAEFLEQFVTKKKYFTQDGGEQEYERIRLKYAGKIEQYRQCVDPNWEVLVAKLKSLGETFNTVERLGKRFAERTNNRVSAMQKRIDANPGLVSAFSANSVGDFFSRLVDFRANNEPILEATVWEKISQKAKDNAPFSNPSRLSGSEPVSFDNIVEDLQTIEKRDKEDNLDMIYMAEYQIKYLQVQGLGVDRLSANLDTLKNTLKSTFTPINRLAVCTANIVGKQCGGG